MPRELSVLFNWEPLVFAAAIGKGSAKARVRFLEHHFENLYI